MKGAQVHRVVIYGSRDDGDDITEHELHGLVQVLRSKGFDDAYYLRESPHKLLESLKEMARILST